MSSETFCLEHGPYDSTLGSCPYCAQEKRARPKAPAPLDDEDAVGKEINDHTLSGDDVTILAGGKESHYGDNDETALPTQEKQDYGADQRETLPSPHRRRSGFLDEPIEYGEEVDVTVIDRDETSLLGWLIVKSSPCMPRGHILKIRPGAIYGRHPHKADVIFDDDKVSGIHARIQVKDANFFLVDLGSANGTWLNGEEIKSATVIKQDDEIKIGDTVFVLKTL